MSLRSLYAAYNDRVQFLVIYIREAHPVDGWDIGSENRITDPQTIEERRRFSMGYGPMWTRWMTLL